MRELSSARAEALRRLLRLSYEEVATGMNRLSGQEFDYADTYRWFRDKSRKPTVALTIYLRMVLRSRWHARNLRRRPEVNEADLMSRVSHLVGMADAKTLERFEKRLRLSEMDVEAAMFKQDI